MKQLNQNKIGFHIEPTNICTLKCPGCERTRFIRQWGKHWKNNCIDIQDLMHFLDCDLTDVPVLLCGNTGDPIYHVEFYELVGALKQRGAHIKIVTNGSYRTKSWWTAVTELLDNNDTITFSIDGLPHNFTKYRINGDWNSISVGIEVAVNSYAKTVWKFIPFEFNQSDIEKAQILSKDLGIDEFIISHSDRFDEETKYLQPADHLLGPRYQAQIQWKHSNTGANIVVDPECQNNKMHYVSASGHYVPCCYLADHRFYYKTQFWKFQKQYNIKHTQFSKIVDSNEFATFHNSLQQQPGCKFMCPQKL
jgi:MoaA/NifB/PqqE/SkfB family radical SAM enzyme